MIIRPEGDRWTLILQTDHADLSGQMARRWGDDRAGTFERPRPFAPVLVAAAHHDDGWRVWEAAPRAVNFIELDVPTHLRLYRAGIAAVAGLDPYAGLLASLHGVGLYNGRFGIMGQTMTPAPEHRAEADAFRRDQETLQAGLQRDLGAPDDEVWRNYRLLQVFDRFSLYFCTEPVDGRAPADLGPAPARPGQPDETLRLTPLGGHRVSVSPYPFGHAPLTVSLIVRRVPAGAPLPAGFAAAEPVAEAYTLLPA